MTAEITGRVIPLPGADIDTDRIMPARFLKAVTFTGLENHLFADDRSAARTAGVEHPFDTPVFQGAAILVANDNFGCGSSREHAPQALQRWGIRAVVAESFAEIFASNALTIGLVCVTASTEVIAALMETTSSEPLAEAHLSLEHLTIRQATRIWPVTMPDASRRALISGEWDGTSLLLADYQAVERVEARLPYLRTAAKNA